VNHLVQKLALSRLLECQKEGNRTLGAVYNDKGRQVNVADQFKYMLSYYEVLPRDLPDFYKYLLDYPNAKPANVEKSFHWEKLKFAMKPTLRIVHVLTMHGDKPDQPPYVIAEKQLYSSNYFETALDHFRTSWQRRSDAVRLLLGEGHGLRASGLDRLQGLGGSKDSGGPLGL